MSRLQKRQVKSSAGSFELVSRSTMKEYLMETNTDRDTVIDGLLLAATALLEEELHYAIDTDDPVYQYFDEFSSELLIFHRFITSTVAVHHLVSGSWTALSTDIYRLDQSSTPPCIRLKANQSWPTTTDDELNSVRVTFTPDTTHTAFNAFKQCIKEMVAGRYEHPENEWQSGSLTSSVQRIIDLYKIP